MSADDFFDNPIQHEPIEPETGLEFYECQKCGEWNILRSTPRKRRTKRPRHIRADDVAWASLKKYAILNNVDMNYAIMLLLHNARTNNVNYLVNERKLVEKSSPSPAKKKDNNK